MCGAVPMKELTWKTIGLDIKVISENKFFKNLNQAMFQGWRHTLTEERESRYDPRKMIKFAKVYAALHNIFVHYKVEKTQIQISATAAPE